jgi:hypothetical protein
MSEKDKVTGFIEEAVEDQGADKPILSAAEIAEIKKKAKTKILAERKVAAEDDLMKREMQRLKNEEGLVTGNSHADEMVTITIDLPNFAPSLVVNMRPYWHGHTYTVARHVAESLRSNMFSCWRHQNEIDGKSAADFYAQRRITEMGRVAKGFTPDPFHPGKAIPAPVARA